MKVKYYNKYLFCQVFTRWQIYIKQCKRKKRRIAEAVEWRKQQLVKKAAAHWLAVSCDLQHQRELLAVKQGLQVNM